MEIDITNIINDGRVLTLLFALLAWLAFVPPILVKFFSEWFNTRSGITQNFIIMLAPTLLAFLDHSWDEISDEIGRIVDGLDNDVIDDVWKNADDRVTKDIDDLQDLLDNRG